MSSLANASVKIRSIELITPLDLLKLQQMNSLIKIMYLLKKHPMNSLTNKFVKMLFSKYLNKFY